MLLFWAFFLAVQIAGYVTPLYGNANSNPVPMYLGLLFLLPGSLLTFTSFLDGSLMALFAVMSVVNLAAWGFVWSRMQRRANRPPAATIAQTESL